MLTKKQSGVPRAGRRLVKLSNNFGKLVDKDRRAPQCESYPFAVGSTGFVGQAAQSVLCQHNRAMFLQFPLDFRATSTDTPTITPPPLSPLVGDAHLGEVFLCARQAIDWNLIQPRNDLQFNQVGGGR